VRSAICSDVVLHLAVVHLAGAQSQVLVDGNDHTRERPVGNNQRILEIFILLLVCVGQCVERKDIGYATYANKISEFLINPSIFSPVLLFSFLCLFFPSRLCFYVLVLSFFPFWQHTPVGSINFWWRAGLGLFLTSS